MNKWIVFLLNFFAFPALWAQLNWTQLNPPPNFAERADPVIFQINDKAYVGLGNGNTIQHLKDFWEYDIPSNSWTQLDSVNFDGIEEGVFFTLNGKGYCGTGLSNFNNMYEFDPANLQWAQKNDFPGQTREMAVALVIDGVAYFGLGWNGNSMLDDWWEYDQTSDAWTQKNNFPGECKYAPIGFGMGNTGYIGFGSGMSACSKEFWQYQPSSDAWVQKNDFPGSPVVFSVPFVIQNYAYAGTGGCFTMQTNDFWRYDASSDTWQMLNALPATLRQGASGFSYGMKAYLLGGVNTASATFLNDFWTFEDPTLGFSNPILKAKTPLKLFPNPASHFLEVDLTEMEANGNWRGEICDVFGKKVNAFSLAPASQTAVSVADLPTGLYFLSVYQDQTLVHTEKLTIQR